ncbi:E3 ubiquitin-protein ligase znrf1 [Aphanomyces cochlioides]|nr:E3 ubiquitin-protein ligase znrf1 [Aphanomyces cochlioides]
MAELKSGPPTRLRQASFGSISTSSASYSYPDDNFSLQSTLSTMMVDERWALTQSRDSCCQCGERFSVWKRPHRCRNCGRSFCRNCSSRKVALNGQTHKSRVCDMCFPHVLLPTQAPPANSFIKAFVPRGLFSNMLSYLNFVDLCIVSMCCRHWYKRASLDIQWRPLYEITFPNDESLDAKFQREIHGIDLENLSWKKKFEMRWIAQRTAELAAEREKSFKAMSDLLTYLSLEKYIPVFEREEIDVEALCMMNAGHLRDLGIPAGPRTKLMNAVALLANVGQDDEEEKRPSIISGPITPVAQLIRQRNQVKQYKASLVRRVQQSTVRIAVLTIDGNLLNVGSGIILHERGLVATARHCLVSEQYEFDCIKNPSSFMVLIAPTVSASEPPAWKYHACALPNCCEEGLDYALLWIEGEVVSDPPCGLYIGDVTKRTIASSWTVRHLDTHLDLKLPAVTIGNSNNVEPGDEMWMFGYPSSGHNTITVHHAICSGTDSQVFQGVEVEKAMLRTAAQLDNGFSGGAAVDRKGLLIGIISFSVLRQDRVRSINMMKGAIELAKSERLGVWDQE